MMNTAIRVEDREKTLKYFNELKQRNLELDNAKYEMVLSAFAEQGNWESALEIKSEMERRKMLLGVRIYSLLIESHLNGGHPKRALKLLQEAKLAHGSNPLLQTTLLRIHANENDGEKA